MVQGALTGLISHAEHQPISAWRATHQPLLPKASPASPSTESATSSDRSHLTHTPTHPYTSASLLCASPTHLHPPLPPPPPHPSPPHAVSSSARPRRRTLARLAHHPLLPPSPHLPHRPHQHPLLLSQLPSQHRPGPLRACALVIARSPRPSTNSRSPSSSPPPVFCFPSTFSDPTTSAPKFMPVGAQSAVNEPTGLPARHCWVRRR